MADDVSECRPSTSLWLPSNPTSSHPSSPKVASSTSGTSTFVPPPLPSPPLPSPPPLPPPPSPLLTPSARLPLQIMKAKVLENELPVFVVSWRTQEILAYRDLATGEITHGSEDKIEQVGYVAVFTRVEEEVENKVTGGWKIIDVSLARRGRRL